MGKMCIKRWGDGDEGYRNIVKRRRYGGKSMYYGKDYILGNKALRGLLLVLSWEFLSIVNTTLHWLLHLE